MGSDSEDGSDAVPVGSLRDRPNQITVARLAATVVCFACLSLGWYGAALGMFVLAAATDWVDGYWARRWGPITKLGRVLDPLADKLLICGVFVYLSAILESDVEPWMAVVIVGRELVVTALRSFVEAGGGDFSAKWLGKQKMGWQCVAAGLSLVQVAGWAGARWTGPWLIWDYATFTFVDLAIWVSLVLTVASGLQYAFVAARSVRAGAA